MDVDFEFTVARLAKIANNNNLLLCWARWSRMVKKLVVPAAQRTNLTSSAG